MIDRPTGSGSLPGPGDEPLARLVSELEGLRAWTAAPETRGSFPGRLWAFLRRTIRRLRMLGKHQELESRILAEALDRIQLLSPALQEVALLRHAMSRLETEIAVLRPVPSDLALLGRRVDAGAAATDSARREFGELALRLAAAESHAGESKRNVSALQAARDDSKRRLDVLDETAARQGALELLRADLDERLATVRALLARHDQRLAAFNEGLAAQQSRTAELDARPRLEPAVADLGGRLTALVGSLEATARSHEGLAEAVQASARSLGELQRLVREHESRFRFLRQEIPALRERPARIALDPGALRRFLAELDEGIPALREARAVEVSIQDSAAESLLFEANRYFGTRMSSSHPQYLSPNDAWIHIDLTADVLRPVLFENAAARLGRDGILIVVATPEASKRLITERLGLPERQAFSLNSVPFIAVVVCRRSPDSRG